MIVVFDAHRRRLLRHERRIFTLPVSVGTRLLHGWRISETARSREPSLASVGTYIACLDSWARPCAGSGTPPMKRGRPAAGRPHHSSLRLAQLISNNFPFPSHLAEYVTRWPRNVDERGELERKFAYLFTRCHTLALLL